MFDIDLQMPLDRRAPGIARHSLDGLAGQVREEDLHRFRVAVSELVTNAIVHGASDDEPALRLAVRVLPDRIVVTVIHSGYRFDPDVHEPRPDQRSGWGLFLVGQLSDRWGIDRDGGTRVWCEFELPARADRVA